VSLTSPETWGEVDRPTSPARSDPRPVTRLPAGRGGAVSRFLDSPWVGAYRADIRRFVGRGTTVMASWWPGG
jgi:hypothetical protein